MIDKKSPEGFLKSPESFLLDTIHSYLYAYKELGYIHVNYNVAGDVNFVISNQETNESIGFATFEPNHTNGHKVLAISSSIGTQTIATFTKGTSYNYCVCSSSKNFDKLLVGYPYSAFNLAEFVIKRWDLPLEQHKHFKTCINIRKLIKECKITLNKTFNNILMG